LARVRDRNALCSAPKIEVTLVPIVSDWAHDSIGERSHLTP
jgi:hypothetical protein